MFRKEGQNLQDGFSTLDVMRRIDSGLHALLRAEEEIESLIQKEQTAAFTELNDSVDIELREVLEDAMRIITISSHDLACCKSRIQDCIKRRVDYLSFINIAEKVEKDEGEKAGGKNRAQ